MFNVRSHDEPSYRGRNDFSSFLRTVFSKHPVSNGREAGREGRGRKTVEREITSRGRTLGGNARTKKSARARDEGPPPRCGIMLNKPT